MVLLCRWVVASRPCCRGGLTAFMSDTNPRVLNENRVLFLDLGINQSIAIKAESRQPSFGCWDGNPCGLGAMSVEKTLWEVTK